MFKKEVTKKMRNNAKLDKLDVDHLKPNKNIIKFLVNKVNQIV